MLSSAVVVLLVGTAANAAAPDGGRRLDLDLSDREAGAVVPKPTPAGAVLRPPRSTLAEPAAYVLEPTSDGGYLYRGVTFDAHVAADGSVTFSNNKASVIERGGGPSVPGRDPFGAKEPLRVSGGPGVRFDLTNEYLRRLHKDPTRDAKAAFLANTFTVRMKLALDARSDLRRAALSSLPAQLNQLWRDRRLTASEREHLLHATFEGLADTQDGAAARAVVRDFARRHLPPKKAATFR